MNPAIDRLRELFSQPPEEFTPVPFWFWNDELTGKEIIRQIRDFYSKGVMGFVIHPRIGIPETIVYLSDRYMDLVETAVIEADRLGMRVILYDEAMYPSGSAKGYVVRDNPAYASRGLQMREYACGEGISVTLELGKGDRFVSAQAVRKIADDAIDPDATLPLTAADGVVSFTPPDDPDRWTIVVFVETYSRGHIRGIHFGEDDGEPHAPSSVDLLNPAAVQSFIRITHDRYYERLGRYFGSTVAAFFTDEPNILGRGPIKRLKPWTDRFIERFLASGLAETDLTALWLNAGERTAEIRRRYRLAVHHRLTETYYKPLHDWCERHGIALTGHPEQSDDIGVLEYFQIPGQDVVWRWVAPEGKAIDGIHTTQAKCASDAARHRGRRRNLNECLGVCSRGGRWHLTGDDMKWYFDWLFVRGTNMLSPHAFYYSIEGDRRRNERPPDVGPNNIWWPHYHLFATYIKRMSWLMTDSYNVTPVALLCSEDRLPWRIAKPLYEQQIEFNYLEQQLLVERCQIADGEISIANQAYSVLLIEDADEIRVETAGMILRFAEQGGAVILYEPDDSGARLMANSERLPSDVYRADSPEEMLSAIERAITRDVSLDPRCAEVRVSHVIKDNLHCYLFVNEGDQPYAGTVRLQVRGKMECWDPWTGLIRDLAVAADGDGDSVCISLFLERRQSMIYCVDPSEEPVIEVEDIAGHMDGKELVAPLVVSGWTAQGMPLPASLVSWTGWQGMEHYSGTVVYESFFEIDEAASDGLRDAILDLGTVHEMAEVAVNGIDIGVAMWAPYRYGIGHAIRPGRNHLRVAVTNSLANRYDGVSLPSGLLGPITVRWIEKRE